MAQQEPLNSFVSQMLKEHESKCLSVMIVTDNAKVVPPSPASRNRRLKRRSSHSPQILSKNIRSSSSSSSSSSSDKLVYLPSVNTTVDKRWSSKWDNGSTMIDHPAVPSTARRFSSNTHISRWESPSCETTLNCNTFLCPGLNNDHEELFQPVKFEGYTSKSSRLSSSFPRSLRLKLKEEMLTELVNDLEDL